MKFSTGVFSASLFVLAGVCSAMGLENSIDLHGSVQIQAQKELFDSEENNNLDQFYGRANFGATYIGEDISGSINIQAFPAGFGYEVLTGATFEQDTVIEERSGIPNFQIDDAWMMHSAGGVDVRVGRFSKTTSKTYHFGNYLNQDPGGRFMGRVATFNAIEVHTKFDIVSSSVILAAGDKNLNTGSLRIYEEIGVSEDLTFGFGYYGNIFDLVRDEDAVLENRFSVVGDYIILPRLIPYFEVGVLEDTETDEWNVPLMIGCSFPINEDILDILALEMEYSPEEIREDNPVGLNLALTKRVSPHTLFQAGISTSTSEDSFGQPVLSMRYTGSF
jgi:hypothetical protein